MGLHSSLGQHLPAVYCCLLMYRMNEIIYLCFNPRAKVNMADLFRDDFKGFYRDI